MGVTMNRILKYTLLLLTLTFMSCKSTAQQYITHRVKQGETLTSIAKEYKVTPYNILKLNKEIQQEEDLAVGTVLLIPGNPTSTEASESQVQQEQIEETEDETAVQEKPIGFKSHKVKRRETFYGITRRYKITEDELKRYNTNLYSAQLKKGMRIEIPIYRRVAPEQNVSDSINADNFEMYIVKPKETRWSIAHKYGIGVDSLLILNPNLTKTTDHLAIGQELKLPIIAGSSVDEQSTQLYESYTVPPKKTMYSLTKEYGITHAEILKLNPEILERGQLDEGMVIRLPKKTTNSTVINTENYIFYEVKPKQTTYSLTRNLGMGYDELIGLNPELERGLKAGMVLKLPKEKALDLEVKNSLVLDRINLLDSIKLLNKPKLLLMLPFRLDLVDMEDTESAKKTIKERNDIKYSLGLYSGVLIALDSIAELGIFVDIKTFDTQLSEDRTRKILSGENIGSFNAIIGPLQPNSLKEVAVQAAANNVPVIAPLAAQSDISLTNVFFSLPSDDVLRTRMLDYVEEQRTDQNIIVIADELKIAVQEKIIERFSDAKTIMILKEEKNINMNIEEFTALLSEEFDNWVFLETDNPKMVSSVSSILNSANTADITVRMFTTNKNKAFEDDVISGSHLSNLNFTYPSADREPLNSGFVQRYRKRFGNNPDKYATRGFDLTYDLLLKLTYKMNLFETAGIIGTTEYTGNKFDYTKDLVSGYFNRATFIMMYDDMRIQEIKSSL